VADEPMNDSDGVRPIKRQCTAHVAAGRQCRRSAIRGGTVCSVHGGSASQVKLAAARRAAEAQALATYERYGGPNGSAAAAVNVAAELGRLIGKVTRFTDFAEARIEALTPDDWQQHDARTAAEVGMFLRACTEARKLLRDVARLGLDERALEAQERALFARQATGAEAARCVQAILADLDLTDAQRAMVPVVVPLRFRELIAALEGS
jgi:hypothetical protein